VHPRVGEPLHQCVLVRVDVGGRLMQVRRRDRPPPPPPPLLQPAADADVVVIMAGLVATEGEDQPDMNLLNDQNRLIAEVGPVNPRTVVVLKDGNPVLLPWIDTVPAVLEAWNQGAEDGHAVADLLFGVVNPSGKLPTTYPRSADDKLVAGPERYPGTDEGDGYP
jgi:beta-glucosidase